MPRASLTKSVFCFPSSLAILIFRAVICFGLVDLSITACIFLVDSLVATMAVSRSAIFLAITADSSLLRIRITAPNGLLARASYLLDAGPVTSVCFKPVKTLVVNLRLDDKPQGVCPMARFTIRSSRELRRA